MRPAKRLDGDALRANVRAFAALGAPVAAVVKHHGYGWGATRIAREVDAVVESYVVADDEELDVLRTATAKPVRLLAETPPERLAHVLDTGAIPTLASAACFAAARAEAARRGPYTVRVGVLDASGWAAIPPHDAAAAAAALGESGLRVELWTHVTSPTRAGAIVDGLAAARATFERAGIAVVATDVAGTAAAAPGTAADRLRIGIGLFGAALGAPVGLRCAIRLDAPVVRRHAPGSVSWAGYGDRAISPGVETAVLRCGYGDGWPSTAAGTDGILAVGMQYTTAVVRDGVPPGRLVGAETDLDDLAARCNVSPHAFVVGLA